MCPICDAVAINVNISDCGIPKEVIEHLIIVMRRCILKIEDFQDLETKFDDSEPIFSSYKEELYVRYPSGDADIFIIISYPQKEVEFSLEYRGELKLQAKIILSCDSSEDKYAIGSVLDQVRGLFSAIHFDSHETLCRSMGGN